MSATTISGGGAYGERLQGRSRYVAAAPMVNAYKVEAGMVLLAGTTM